MTSPYNWGLSYVPPSSFSPKSYKLVHTFQMASLDRESPVQPIDSDNNSIENDVSSITDEADYIKVFKKILFSLQIKMNFCLILSEIFTTST
jgi:hypothetical protein